MMNISRIDNYNFDYIRTKIIIIVKISNHQFDLIWYDNLVTFFFDIIDNYNFDYVRTKLIKLILNHIRLDFWYH